jgi:hypothetical protein
VVLPTPGAPSSSRASGPSAIEATKRRSRSSSWSLPTISAGIASSSLGSILAGAIPGMEPGGDADVIRPPDIASVSLGPA